MLEYALELMFCMLSQQYAIGLQTGCMVTVLAPVVEAARLPRVCPMALGYGLPPCDNNNHACLNGRDTSKPRVRGGLSPAAGSRLQDPLHRRPSTGDSLH